MWYIQFITLDYLFEMMETGYYMDTYFQLCLKCHVMSVRYYVRINVNNDFSAVKQASTILRHTNNRGDLPFPRY